MGGQKSKPINLTTETNRTKVKRTNQTDSQQTPDNRQLG